MKTILCILNPLSSFKKSSLISRICLQLHETKLLHKGLNFYTNPWEKWTLAVQMTFLWHCSLPMMSKIPVLSREQSGKCLARDQRISMTFILMLKLPWDPCPQSRKLSQENASWEASISNVSLEDLSSL